jgi:hypothetical protein
MLGMPSHRFILMPIPSMWLCAMQARFQSAGSPAPPIEMRSLIRGVVDQVILAADRIDIHLKRAKIAAALQARVQGNTDLEPVVLSIEAKLRRAGKGKRLIIANGANAQVN